MNRPQDDFLGIEVHRPGVGSLLQEVAGRELSNVRVSCRDAVEVLNDHIGDATLDGVYLFFPDPWHKTRHHKRRIVQTPFVDLIASKLQVGGVFHLATDWEGYAHHMLQALTECNRLSNQAVSGSFATRGERPITKYERRGLRLGHAVWDLIFQRVD